MKFQIDHMELADIGHPRTLARGIQAQIREQLKRVPPRFPLKELAKELGIREIINIPSSSIEGMLIAEGGIGIIGISNKANPRRARFTLAHELGHFTIPTHVAGKYRFECGRGDLRARRPDKGRLADVVSPQVRKEIEANEFAAELLVPAIEYQTEREKLGEMPSVLHIRALANQFGVSSEMMARTYVEREDQRVGILLSQNGRVQKFVLPKIFPFFGLRKGSQLPHRSRAFAAISAGAQYAPPEMENTEIHAWFDENQQILNIAEQTVVLSNGWAMTMLLVELMKDRTDLEEDELLRPADQMRSRGRGGNFAWD